MRRAVLIAVLLLAGCAGGDEAAVVPEQAVPEPVGPSLLEVHIVTAGESSIELRGLSAGRIVGQAELSEPLVFNRAGSDPDRQSIGWEEIYVRDPEGSERRLTHDRRADLSPQLLRDGRVAFISCEFLPDGREVPPECRLDAIDPPTRARETLLDDLGVTFDGALSPDERSFLFTRQQLWGPVTGLFVRELDGGEEEQVADATGGAWSPDGRRIAFVSDRDENGPCLFHDCFGNAGEIYVADADGSDERRLTDNPQHDSAPEWSGDGEWIVFARIADEEGDWDLHAVRADGECEVQLTDTPRWEVGAVWHGGGHGGLSC